MDLHYVDYGLSKWKGKLCSTCLLFTNENVSYIPVGRIIKTGGIESVIDYYKKLGESYYQELLDIFKIVAKNILDKENDMMLEIYSIVSETESKSDYSREINEVDKKIEEIKNARAELINMRARKEIEGDEYNEAREKYNNELSVLDKKKQSYLSMNSEVDYKSNIDDFFKKIHDIILEDDESVFKIFGSILDTILVERLESEEDEDTHKVMLHFKLNIVGYNNSSLNLKDFLLLFSNNDRCGSDKKAVASYRRRNNNITTLKPYVLKYYYKLYM